MRTRTRTRTTTTTIAATTTTSTTTAEANQKDQPTCQDQPKCQDQPTCQDQPFGPPVMERANPAGAHHASASERTGRLALAPVWSCSFASPCGRRTLGNWEALHSSHHRTAEMGVQLWVVYSFHGTNLSPSLRSDCQRKCQGQMFYARHQND